MARWAAPWQAFKPCPEGHYTHPKFNHKEGNGMNPEKPYSQKSLRELRKSLDEDDLESWQGKHAFAEIQVRTVLAQKVVSVLLAVFSGIVALAAIYQAVLLTRN
jgi:hypothetical protein